MESAEDPRRRFIVGCRDRFVDELAEWVRIPSVAGDPDRADAMHWSAQHLAARFRTLGFPRVEVWPQGESVGVFAEWMPHPGGPVVLVYSHHDVRAVRGEEWEQTAPFEPAVRDGVMFGRGASDAKGQVAAHLQAVAAHVAVDGRPPVNLRFLIDGEEELGSPHLAGVLREHADDIAADLVLYSDTLLADADRPAVCTSVRGMIGATLTVHGPDVDVHSGTVSGAAPNPIHDLAAVVAAMHDDEGRLVIPGLADDTGFPVDEERAYEELDIDPHDWARRTESGRSIADGDHSLPERLWTRPAIEVISITGGDTHDLPRAVIPATATAELSIRLAGDQHPQAAAAEVERWVAERLRGIRYELEFDHHTAEAPYRTPPDHPAVDALAAAMAVGWQVDVARVGRMGNGGGGPADLLARSVGAPVLFFGTGLPSDRWHAPDERVRLDVLERGAITLAEFWRRVPGTLGGDAP